MKRQVLLAVFLFTAIVTNAQKIMVTEQQIKVLPGKTYELLYGFAAGDRIIFTAEVQDGFMSEIAVAEYPETYKFREYTIKKEKNREFTVTQKAVYRFTFNNASDTEKICDVKIQRVPANKELRNFNTAIKMRTVQDTLWSSVVKDAVVGYDTLLVQKTRKVPASVKRYEEVVLDKNQRVSSMANMGDNRASVVFDLPANVQGSNESKKVIAWAYWVGVGEESNEFWKQNRKMIVGAVQGATTLFTSPLGGIAAGAATNLILPTNGEDVQYALANDANRKLFEQKKPYKTIDGGKGIAGYKRFTEPNMLQGKYYMLLENDNYVQPLDVAVKVSAIIEHTVYKDEKYTDRTITPRYEKKIVREPQIVSRTIPVTADYR